MTNQEHLLRGLQRWTSLGTLKASKLFLLLSHFMVHRKCVVPQKLVLSLQLKSSCSCRARPPKSLSWDQHQITSGSDELSVKPLMTRTSYSAPYRVWGCEIDRKKRKKASEKTTTKVHRTFMVCRRLKKMKMVRKTRVVCMRACYVVSVKGCGLKDANM